MKLKKFSVLCLLLCGTSFICLHANKPTVHCSSTSLGTSDTTRVRLKPVKDTHSGDGENDDINPSWKAPIRCPEVLISGTMLFLYSGCDNTTFELYADDETMVYSTDIPEGTEQIALPSDLTGVFELRITRGSITFVAEIEL